MNTCPCCSQNLLQYFSNHRSYLFCTSCWQEMPDLSNVAQMPARTQVDQPHKYPVNQPVALFDGKRRSPDLSA